MPCKPTKLNYASLFKQPFPQFILEDEISRLHGADCNIIRTQPLRIFAVSVAARISSEREENLGETVDCGRAKETSYDALNKLACLLPSWISKASAHERRERAGRVQPGFCYRLYPKMIHDAMLQYQLPEILRKPLQELCLHIKSLQLGAVGSFLAKALQPSDPLAAQNAIELLKTIGALDDMEELTRLGMSPSLHTTIGSKHWEDASNGFYLSML
ncbi:unnamed protein product [Prunus armeniaca]